MGESLKCNYQHNTLAFANHGVRVLLMGEHEVPTRPLICTTEFALFINNNDINILGLGGLLPPSLDGLNGVTSFVNENSPVLEIMSYPILTKYRKLQPQNLSVKLGFFKLVSIAAQYLLNLT